MRPLREAAAGRSVDELSAGRFRVIGRVVAVESTPSRIDETPCVYRETAEYRTVGTTFVPVMREVGHAVVAYPFYVDDGTGRVWIDPTHAVVDTVTLHADEGLLAERRLRVGEEVEVVASFQPTLAADSDDGPYRAPARTWRAVLDGDGPPRISYRTHGDMMAIGADDTVGFLRGAGFVMVLVSVALTALRLL